MARGEYAASYPLRQALFDLAAVSGLLAEELRGKIYRPELLVVDSGVDRLTVAIRCETVGSSVPIEGRPSSGSEVAKEES
jgi:hypothetical protein